VIEIPTAIKALILEVLTGDKLRTYQRGTPQNPFLIPIKHGYRLVFQNIRDSSRLNFRFCTIKLADTTATRVSFNPWLSNILLFYTLTVLHKTTLTQVRISAKFINV